MRVCGGWRWCVYELVGWIYTMLCTVWWQIARTFKRPWVLINPLETLCFCDINYVICLAFSIAHCITACTSLSLNFSIPIGIECALCVCVCDCMWLCVCARVRNWVCRYREYGNMHAGCSIHSNEVTFKFLFLEIHHHVRRRYTHMIYVVESMNAHCTSA